MGTGFERESSLGSPIYERYGIDELMLACLGLGKKHDPKAIARTSDAFFMIFFNPQESRVNEGASDCIGKKRSHAANGKWLTLMGSVPWLRRSCRRRR